MTTTDTLKIIDQARIKQSVLFTLMITVQNRPLNNFLYFFVVEYSHKSKETKHHYIITQQ